MANDPTQRRNEREPGQRLGNPSDARSDEQDVKPANEQVVEDTDDEWRRAGGAADTSDKQPDR